jgi:hypothetical protein
MKSKEEIKLEFFKQFGNESFRGYPLEQCHSIWDFFEKYIQCQEDMAKELEMHILVNEHDWSRNPQAQLKDFINSLNKQD